MSRRSPMSPTPLRRGRCVGGALLALALLLASNPAAAQILAPAGRTLFNRGVLVRSLLRVDTFSEPGPGRLRRVSQPVAVVWGARPNLSLSFVTPWVRVEADGPGGSETTTGTGDTTVLARYDVWRRDVPRGSTRLAPEVGVKLPTGGAFGTGSTDLVAGLVFSRVRDPHWLVADVQATFPSGGDGGLEAGDRVRGDLAYLARLLPRDAPDAPGLYLVLELGGQHRERDRRDGAALVGTGGEVVRFSPGVELMVSRRVVLELAAPVVVHEALHGNRPVPEQSFILGARWLF